MNDFDVVKKYLNYNKKDLKNVIKIEESLKESDIIMLPQLEIFEIEGNLLDGRNIRINADGMISGSLRNSKDGVTYFGPSRNRVF